jgi:hypothetical protein
LFSAAAFGPPQSYLGVLGLPASVARLQELISIKAPLGKEISPQASFVA